MSAPRIEYASLYPLNSDRSYVRDQHAVQQYRAFLAERPTCDRCRSRRSSAMVPHPLHRGQRAALCRECSAYLDGKSHTAPAPQARPMTDAERRARQDHLGRMLGVRPATRTGPYSPRDPQPSLGCGSL